MPLWDHFDVIAPLYDRVIKRGDLGDIISLAKLPVDGILMDAGGGTGRIAEVLVDLVTDLIVVDLSEGMLRQAALKDGLLPLCSHTESLPFADASFDRVIMVDALHHVCDHQKTADELLRVVKPGGRILIEEPNILKPSVRIVALLEKLALMRSHFISPKRIADLFILSGAETVEIHQKGYTAWVIAQK